MQKSEKKPRPAVFLDRDGTIIEDRGHLSTAAQVVFFSETIPSLQRLQEHFDLFIVPNQSGVAKGVISAQDVARVNAYIESYLAGAGIRIAATYVCPHGRNDGCACIKPKPYFPKKAEKDHGIDLRHSFVIGDHPHDVALAASVGASGIYLLSGHGYKHRQELSGDFTVVDGIGDATELIINGVNNNPEQ